MANGAQQGLSCDRDTYKCLRIILFLSLTVVLTGCGYWPFGESSKKTSPTTQVSAPAPDFSSPEITDPAPSYVSSYVDPLLEAGPVELSPNGSLGALGLNLDTYFANNLNGMHTNEARITRVENVVTAIQKDLRRMAPPIQRLIAVERDIQALVTQLSKLAQSQPEAIMPTTVSGTSPPQTSKVTKTNYAASPNQSGGKMASGNNAAHVKKLRIGEHKDKTRIVLDVSAPATFRYDLDNSENLLVIELPDASWSAQKQWQGKKSPLLASYSAAAIGNSGTRLVIQLKENAAVVYESAIKANGHPDYRIVIDLKGASTHKK